MSDQKITHYCNGCMVRHPEDQMARDDNGRLLLPRYCKRYHAERQAAVARIKKDKPWAKP